MFSWPVVGLECISEKEPLLIAAWVTVWTMFSRRKLRPNIWANINCGRIGSRKKLLHYDSQEKNYLAITTHLLAGRSAAIYCRVYIWWSPIGSSEFNFWINLKLQWVRGFEANFNCVPQSSIVQSRRKLIILACSREAWLPSLPNQSAFTRLPSWLD